ncbi:heme ABC transporter ChuBCD, ATP-binding protein [Campylobacter porcelli]|uniref:Heme ABC transporter ChuBCD, ATP-binding protein n=1 Tax=Campylobacter porcelli TaxID=1660073 RepID=A0A1X9SYP2_9BACT|nr:heme ABC transporter ChuBCD, ATP-binding protein [Campylobacter sp. RM6137]
MGEICVKDLSFGYDKSLILENINLSAKSGEFIGILGANGSGKSTLLKNLLRLIEPKSGIIKINDKPLQNYTLKELAQTIGFVPQKSALSMPLSVFDILLMGRFSYLKNSFENYSNMDIKKVNEIMDLLKISKFKDRIANSLSGGEFQRVLLARALISEPKALFLDEPTSALDLHYAVEMMKICKNLTKKLNLLSLMVIHDLNLASMFCDRLIMLKDGKICYSGAPRELFKKEILKEIYCLDCEIIEYNGSFFVIASKD